MHQVLSHERIHNVRVTTVSLETNAYVSAAISDCQVYGELVSDQAGTRGPHR